MQKMAKDIEAFHDNIKCGPDYVCSCCDQLKGVWNKALRATLCKILISSFAHKMDFANNFSVDFF